MFDHHLYMSTPMSRRFNRMKFSCYRLLSIFMFISQSHFFHVYCFTIIASNCIFPDSYLSATKCFFSPTILSYNNFLEQKKSIVSFYRVWFAALSWIHLQIVKRSFNFFWGNKPSMLIFYIFCCCRCIKNHIKIDGAELL